MLVTDALNRKIEFNFPPQRVISLVPSITEFLFDIGLNDDIIGVTRFCIHPEEAKTKTIVGGTKNADVKLINELKPDLIFAEKSENQKDNVLDIARTNPVFVFDIHNFDDAINMMLTIGELTNKRAHARILTDKIIGKFLNLDCSKINKTVFYPVWKKPYYTINGNTFINSMLNFCGLKNIFADKKEAYPVVNIDEVKAKNPNIILLPSEPYKFLEKDKNELQKLFPGAEIFLVDGEMFTWYGSRMLKSADYLSFLCKKLEK